MASVDEHIQPPPWLCHKRKFLFLTILIQGPKQPGIEIDVFLEPLMEDMQKLWEDGVQMWDEYRQEAFTLRAIIFVTINDYPALFSLSGQKKGKTACVVCLNGTNFVYLKGSTKTVYMGHRRYLLKSHKYRKMADYFDGTHEKRFAPQPATGSTLFEICQKVKFKLGKKSKGGADNSKRGRKLTETTENVDLPFKKMSIFFKYLPYWKELAVRHAIDGMHLQKNVFDSTIGFLGLTGKVKDGLKSRKDLVELKIRPELHPQQRANGKQYLPPASYNLTQDERLAMCKCLRGLKVPTGFSSNIRSLVSLKDMTLTGYNSHDCHVMITVFLAIAIRAVKPIFLKMVITRMCYFFNVISQKVVDCVELARLGTFMAETQAKLEMCFPPSFFDIMEHLMIHMVEQITELGPMYFHQMWTYERFMSILNGYMRNYAFPEGSMIESYHTEEVVDCCIDYIKDKRAIGLPESRHEGRLSGRGTIGRKRFIDEDNQKLEKAHSSVLQQLAIVEPFIVQHLNEIREENSSRSEDWVIKEQKRRFTSWLKEHEHLFHGDSIEDATLMQLASGPSSNVTSWQAYEINGYTFYTKAKDNKSVAYQNSGVRIDAIDTSGKTITYYGFIEEIWELDYGQNIRIPVFWCQWVKHPNGVTDDNYGLTLVDLANVGYKDDPWVLAERVAQVFYISDPMNVKKHIAISGKQRILGVEGVVDVEDYNQYEELDLFKDHENRIKKIEASIPTSEKPWLRRDCEGRVVNG